MIDSLMRSEFQEYDVAKEPIACMLCSLDEYRNHVGHPSNQSLANVYHSSIQVSDKIETVLYRMMFSRL